MVGDSNPGRSTLIPESLNCQTKCQTVTARNEMQAIHMSLSECSCSVADGEKVGSIDPSGPLVNIGIIHFNNANTSEQSVEIKHFIH